MPEPTPADSKRSAIPTTHWSLIERLKDGDPTQAGRALDELCRAYHYPLYCLIRRRGLPHHDAEDALHEFFSKLLRNDTFSAADAARGRLRCLLMTALQRFLNNWQRDQQKLQKKEISREAISAMAEAEGRFEMDEMAHQESPDRLYDRQWAVELMRLVMQRLRGRYEARGKAALFDTLRPVLLSGGSLTDHDGTQLALQLGIKPGALRTSLNRLLEHYREALREEVLQTVGDRDQAKAEYEELKAVFPVA